MECAGDCKVISPALATKDSSVIVKPGSAPQDLLGSMNLSLTIVLMMSRWNVPIWVIAIEIQANVSAERDLREQLVREWHARAEEESIRRAILGADV